MNYRNIINKVFLTFWISLMLVNSVFADNIFTDSGKLPFCKNNDCWYQKGVSKVKSMLWNAETSKSLSDYIQDIVIYLLTFITIIAVIYVIYAWFRILIWWWNDESLKNSRKTILHVVIWVIIIWLAFSIVALFIDILYSASKIGN